MSVLTDRNGIPIGWTIDGANRNDSVLLAPTLDAAAARWLLGDVETIWLDRGYDSDATRQRLADRNLDDAVSHRQEAQARISRAEEEPADGTALAGRTDELVALELRPAKPQQDRKTMRRLAQFALAVAFLLTAKLIDWRNRWSPDLSPIR